MRAARPEPDADLAVQQRVVNAFVAAARAGDFEAPCSHSSTPMWSCAPTVAGTARWLARRSSVPAGPRGVPGRRNDVRPARPPRDRQRRAGVVVGPPGTVVAVVGFSVVAGLIREIDIIGDPAKLQGLQGLPIG